MGYVKDLYDLIEQASFAIKIKDLDYDDFGLVFRTSFVCNSSLYLSVSIYIEHGEFVVSTALNYLRDKVTPISKKSYSIDNKRGIIDDLSSMLSKLAELDNSIAKNFEKFNRHEKPQSDVTWKQGFIEELTRVFGRTETTLMACSVTLYVHFDEETDSIKVILSRGLSMSDEKYLLYTTVNETNYRGVLDTVKTIYSEFRNNFYDIIDIISELKNLGE